MNIDKLIAEAIHNQDKVRMNTLRAFKNEILKARTEKNAKPIDEVREVQLLNRMIKQRTEAASMYEEANRIDLANNEKAEISILKEFLPEEVSEAVIEKEILTCGIDLVKANMGSIIRIIKQKYPTADGKMVSDMVKMRLE